MRTISSKLGQLTTALLLTLGGLPSPARAAPPAPTGSSRDQGRIMVIAPMELSSPLSELTRGYLASEQAQASIREEQRQEAARRASPGPTTSTAALAGRAVASRPAPGSTAAHRTAAEARPARAPAVASSQGPTVARAAEPVGPTAEVRREPAPPPRREATDLTVEAGPWLTQGAMSFSGVAAGSATLLDRTTGAVVLPRIRVEVAPLARLGVAWLEPLRLSADYATSVGLESQGTVDGAAVKAASRLWRLDLALGWRLSLGTLELTPALGFAQRGFSTSGEVEGLPQVTCSGVRASLGAALPVGAGVTLLTAAAAADYATTGELAQAGSRYFQEGRARALELEAGAELALHGGYALRLVADAALTSFTLQAAADAAYQADGATERTLGARLTLVGRY